METTQTSEGLHPFKFGQRLYRKGHQVPKNHPDFTEIFHGYLYECGYVHGLEGKNPRLDEPLYTAGHTTGRKIRLGQI
jgi:hypothetical protein